jgi:glycosyltransferase involved in cell wall biosynthesis
MAAMVEEEMERGGFEALFVDHWLMAQYVPHSFEGLRLLHEHNAEYVIWERQAKRSRNPLVKAEARRVRRYEGEILSQFERVFAVSAADREALMDLGIAGGRVGILPNIPDPALLRVPPLRFEDTEPVIAYLGTLSWQPNIDGLQRFLTDVFPLVRERLPDARFLVAGRDAPPKLEALAKRTRGVEFLGDIEDPETLYSRARVMVEATTTGGGTKLKVLNSLARGLPVVASAQAADGLDVREGDNILIARGDVLMAEAILRVMGDAVLWQRVSEGGRGLVREKYVAEVAFRSLDEALSDALVPH